MDAVETSNAPEAGTATSADGSVVERLGPGGLERVLGDLFDPPRLVKLANACKLSYPGMRMQAQKREKILKDLVAKASVDEVAQTKVLRAIRKELGAAAAAWSGIEPAEKLRRLRGEGRSDRGTESLAVLSRKLEAYRSLWGQAPGLFGFEQFGIAVVCAEPSRRSQLAAALKKAWVVPHVLWTCSESPSAALCKLFEDLQAPLTASPYRKGSLQPCQEC